MKTSNGCAGRPALGAKELQRQLDRANRLIGWMMPYIGSMCPPEDGLYDLNLHCCENKIPKPDDSTKGAPIKQRHDLGRRG